ncbi:MAG: alanine/glycine:cation symporter family protein, partial [Anaerovoracaceae bacterium]
LPGVQSNAISGAFENAFNTPPWITGAVVAIVLGIIIFGGIKRIAKFAEVVVPFMAIAYIIVALIVVLIDFKNIGNVFALIFTSAFGANELFGGILGSAIAWGVKRGVYSNEAGQGSQPHAAAAAEVSHPAKQGLVQGFGVYVDTLFICSATAFMILITDCFNVIGKDGTMLYVGEGSSQMAEFAATETVGPQYVQTAIGTLFGGFGGPFVAIILAFFAFTTIMSYYYQAECNVTYLFKDAETDKGRKVLTLILRLIMVAIVFISCLFTSTTAWAVGDIGVGMTAWLNIVAILILQVPALKCLKDFEEQRKQGIDPVFDPVKLGIKNADIWIKIKDKTLEK